MIKSKSVGSASVHSNTITPLGNAVPDNTVLKGGYPYITELELYIPVNLNMNRVLQDTPPNFKYHIDNFIYILHLITSISSKKRDEIQKMKGYTPINRQILQRRIRDYKKYLDYLLRNGILETNNFYIPKKQSTGLKFTNRYNTQLKQVFITKWPLIKSIIYKSKGHNIEHTEKLYFLKNWFDNKIEINLTSGLEYLNQQYENDIQSELNNPMLIFNARLLPFKKMYQKKYDFHVDNTGYRLHTNISQLKTELRKYIKYDNKHLCAIDITNSQPYLSITLLSKEVFVNNKMQSKITNPYLSRQENYPNMLVDLIELVQNEDDVLLYKKLVSEGSFYENFGRIMIEKGLIDIETINPRSIAKEATFATIFSPNNSISYNPSVRIFKELFPNVYRVFSLVKKGKYNHNTLSICLQRLEAEIVLHKVCKFSHILKPRLPLFTLHDAIITTEENVEFINFLLKLVLKKKIGIEPSLKLEYWK